LASGRPLHARSGRPGAPQGRFWVYNGPPAGAPPMGEKWADYLVSAVEYGPGRRIERVMQHEDTGGELGEGTVIDRSTLASNISRGVRYATVFDASSKWRLGEAIRCHRVGSGNAIRTDENRAEYDHLGMLPELK